MYKGKFVIDSHCHIYPEKIAEKAIAGTDNFYGVKSSCKGTAADLIERGTAAGIDKFIVQSVATTPKQVPSINEFIADEVEKSGGRFIGFGTLYPDSPDLEADYNHMISLGLKGVKLHPDIQRFKVDDFRCLKIYELCERDNIPVLMHTGDYRYDFSNPNRILPIMNIYTGLTLVGAHFGGWSVYEEACEKLKDLPNFYVDCSSTFGFGYCDREKIRKLIYTYGTDRVLFGTDYPMWKAEDELNILSSLDLSEEDMIKILAENAKKVFGIGD